jgi:hypothetical protein
MRKGVRDSLVSIFFSKRAWNRLLERRVSICMHRLATNNEIHLTSTSLRHAELSLLGSIMRRSHSQQGIDLSRLKHTLFLESDPIKELCCSRDISTVELAGGFTPCLDLMYCVMLFQSSRILSELAFNPKRIRITNSRLRTAIFGWNQRTATTSVQCVVTIMQDLI